MSMTLVVIKDPAKRPLGLALFALLTTLAPALGPTLGGYLTELHGWPAIFYINWIPGIFMVVGLLYGMGHTPPQWSLVRSVDWLAIGCMVLGLGCMIVVLEEGNSHDWFDSAFIQLMSALSVAGILGWMCRYAAGGQAFVNLGLYGQRNFLIASLLAAISGFALYGSSFLLPLYLGQIPGYTPMQIGEVIMWVGLPQIAVMPFAMIAARLVDNRIVCSFGLALFGISCLMNVGLDANSGRDQLIASQIVRAMGQPLITLTLSNFAIQSLTVQQRLSASALYNMARNLGGSIGIGLLSAALINRANLHSGRIGETISSSAPITLSRLEALGRSFIARGIDSRRAHDMALITMDRILRRESYVMAYNDCYWLIGILLLASIGLLWSLSKVTSAPQ